jgi:pyridoxine/pyridoxamine 5'-phosphate oxidase
MGDYRKGVDYRDGGEIKIADPSKPLSLLDEWIEEARGRGLVEPNAMSVATVDTSGAPRSRMVLLKMVEGDEIGFFTNLESDKSLEIANCNSVAVNMWWPEMERQVRMEGIAYQMERSQVEEYHHSRSRKSRIGATLARGSRSSSRSSREERSRFLRTGGGSESRLTGWSTGQEGPAGCTRGSCWRGRATHGRRGDSTPDRGF